MNCPESAIIQDFLDGELPAVEAERFRAHLQTCVHCGVEVASFGRVFASLAAAPTWDPGPALTERILDHTLPSRLRRRRRRLAVIGWGYAASLAASIAGLAWGFAQPAPRALAVSLSSAASHAVLQGAAFLLGALAFSLTRLASGWGWLTGTGMKLAPLARAFGALLGQPAVVVSLSAALLVCGVLLWWMRPRAGGSGEEIRHVGVLGV